MPGPNSSADDDFVLVILGCLAAGAALGSVGLWRRRIVSWLVEQELLLPATSQPLLTLPGTDGCGLDLARLAVVAAALLVLGAVIFSAIRRAVLRRHQLAASA